jgi:replication-associated recombination protein RarA
MKTKLIGHAGVLLDMLHLTLPAKDRVKLLFNGNPGIGKSEVARQVAHQLCGGAIGVEEIIGRKASIHIVSAWEEEFATSCMWGTGFKIRIVNEIDTMPKDALDAMLALLDDMPKGRGIIGTTNLPFAELPERFRSRFQLHSVKAPAEHEIAELLREEAGVPDAVALQLATLCGGNVRAALLDAEAWSREAKVQAKRVVKPQQFSFAALGL